MPKNPPNIHKLQKVTNSTCLYITQHQNDFDCKKLFNYSDYSANLKKTCNSTGYQKGCAIRIICYSST